MKMYDLGNTVKNTERFRGTELYCVNTFTPPAFHPPEIKNDFSITDKQDAHAILMVDDEPTNLLLLEALINSYVKLNGNRSLKTYKAPNGQEAVILCQKYHNINLIIMDIGMPIMDGFEATRLIKSERPGIKIVCLTAFSSQETRIKAKQAGCDDFVTKPISKSHFFKLLNRYILNN